MLEQPDAKEALRYYKENDAHLAPFSPLWPEDFFTLDFWHKQVERNIEEAYTDKSLRLFVFEKGDNKRVIASIGFGGFLRNAANFCYLGYGLARDKQGLGYMTESIPAAIQFVFNDLNMHRIMANYMPTNERSGKLLKRLGFTVEGYARDYLFLNGKWQDHILTSLTNPNWRE
jgi:[ribosomal protein S5]-alanine N-acetyltransferase